MYRTSVLTLDKLTDVPAAYQRNRPCSCRQDLTLTTHVRILLISLGAGVSDGIR